MEVFQENLVSLCTNLVDDLDFICEQINNESLEPASFLSSWVFGHQDQPSFLLPYSKASRTHDYHALRASLEGDCCLEV